MKNEEQKEIELLTSVFTKNTKAEIVVLARSICGCLIANTKRPDSIKDIVSAYKIYEKSLTKKRKAKNGTN